MYERYCKLRDSLNLKDIDVAKATGLSSTVFSDWKSGKSKPNTDKLIKITKVLGCSVEYLVTGEERETEHYYLNEETAKVAQAIFENKELKLLFDTAKTVNPEDLQIVHAMLKALKKKDSDVNE